MMKNEKLFHSRKEKGWSQQQLADKLGVTKITVGRWERGVAYPHPYTIGQLITIFGKNREQLGFEQPTLSSTNFVPPPPSDVPQKAIYDSLIPAFSRHKLVGRDKSLLDIKQILFRTENVVLTASLNGLPGVGKTALATAIAHDRDIRAHFMDGILWAPLGPEPNIYSLFLHWGTLLGLSDIARVGLQTIEQWAKALRNLIGTRSFLIIIDDAWILDHALIFRVGGPNCAHLLTTRFPQIASHIGLHHATTIEELNEDQSLELLTALAPKVVQQEPQEIQNLIKMVGGLPLALTLMGNYLRSIAFAGPHRRVMQAIDHLYDSRQRLQISEPHIVSESHPSLQSSLSLSLRSILEVTDQRLSEPIQQTLYALSIFPPKPKSFSEEAALYVAQCTTKELDPLLDAGFVECAGNRYRLHQVIADYASLQLSPEQKTTITLRFIIYTQQLLAHHPNMYHLFHEESSIIFAALNQAETDYPLHFIDIVLAIAPILIVHTLYAQAKDYFSRALNLAKASGDLTRIASILLFFGQMYYRQSAYSLAKSALKEGLDIARSSQNTLLLCDFLLHIGSSHWRLGEFTLAREMLEEALCLAREDRQKIGILKVIGTLEGDTGALLTAQDYFEEAILLARNSNDQLQIAILLGNIGIVKGQTGQIDEAITDFQESLKRARELRAHDHTCVTLVNLANILAKRRKAYKEAEIYLQEALDVTYLTGTLEWQCIVLSELASVAVKRGYRFFDKAEHYLQKGFALANDVRPRVKVNLHLIQGDLLLAQRQWTKAKHAYEKVKEILPKGEIEWYALAQFGLAQIAKQEEQMEDAYHLGCESVDLLRKMHHMDAEMVEQWVHALHFVDDVPHA